MSSSILLQLPHLDPLSKRVTNIESLCKTMDEEDDDDACEEDSKKSPCKTIGLNDDDDEDYDDEDDDSHVYNQRVSSTNLAGSKYVDASIQEKTPEEGNPLKGVRMLRGSNHTKTSLVILILSHPFLSYLFLLLTYNPSLLY